jgi:cytochrome c oxidase subunit 2
VTPAAAAPGVAGFTYPADRLPVHVRPSTPIPAGLTFDANLQGDAARGKTAFVSCIGCHYINGNRLAQGKIGPNLTHIGTRNTIAGGLFPNDTRHLALWIKNARAMKPGVTMPTLGLNQTDPVTKMTVKAGGLTDQQIADIVAYLQALK